MKPGAQRRRINVLLHSSLTRLYESQRYYRKFMYECASFLDTVITSHRAIAVLDTVSAQNVFYILQNVKHYCHTVNSFFARFEVEYSRTFRCLTLRYQDSA